MSKALRRTSWVVGTLITSSSILESGYVSHAKGFADSELKAMAMASQIQLINGIGLCLCATRKTKLIALPFISLTASTILFSGLIFYSKTQKDFRFNKLIPVGGACSIGGWLLMAIC
jgi:uncharacterized membrane protein YgdD (TMEM256/DUF423 family)